MCRAERDPAIELQLSIKRVASAVGQSLRAVRLVHEQLARDRQRA
jgi:hypothetical protein